MHRLTAWLCCGPSGSVNRSIASSSLWLRRCASSASALREVAERWYVPHEKVLELWARFLRATGGSYTLSLARAKQTVLEHELPGVHQAAWELVVTDSSSAGLTDSSAAGLEGGEAGGAGGLNFEEYVVFCFFTSAGSLEEQFRFLWALFDRDRDGALGRDDVSHVLKVQQKRLGWDDEYRLGWVRHVFNAVPHDGDVIRPHELRAALHQWEALRLLLMAREPRAGRRAAGGWSLFGGAKT
jgi:hypothetical protein